MIIAIIALAGSIALGAPATASRDTTEQTMSLDFKDTDIRDVIRAVSKSNNLNIILDTNVTGKVTLHLTNVPLLEGLRSIAEPNGLEVVQDGRFYKIRKKTDEERALIRFVNDKLTIDVQNMDVRLFLQDLSAKTAMSIVPDSKVSGKVSGKLFQVALDDGIRAILEGNGFEVSRHRNIYQVSVPEQAGNNGMGNSPGRGSPMYRQSGSKADFFVDYANNKLTIEVTNGDLEDLIKAIAEQTGIQIVTYGSLKSDVTAKLYDAEIADAFALLLRGTRFTFVQKDNVILVGDRNAATPSGQALSTSQLIPLKHIKADAIPPILPYNIPANNIKVIKEQNALLVSGSSDDIEMVRDFLENIDIPTPQVRIDALIVEYKENIERELGINYWGSSAAGKTGGQYWVLPAPETSVYKGSSYLELGASGKAIKSLLNGKALNFLSDEFFAVIKILESQDKARVLGQPSIMTLNGYKATINVDETQYFKITTGVAENYTTRFQPIKFGIQLNITPWISQSGQIIAEISPEVSNSEKTNAEGYPNISSRSLTTTARLNDGQTLVLGGLTKNSEQEFARKIPLLGDIPIIGALFRYSGKTRSKTNLTIYITPHIISTSDTVNLASEIKKYEIQSNTSIERRIEQSLDRMQSSHPDSIGDKKSPPAEKTKKAKGEKSSSIKGSSSISAEENTTLIDTTGHQSATGTGNTTGPATQP